MDTSVLSTKGQLLIPKRLRMKYNFKEGEKVALVEAADGLILKPVNKQFFESFSAILTKNELPDKDEFLKWKKEEVALETNRTKAKRRSK